MEKKEKDLIQDYLFNDNDVSQRIYLHKFILDDVDKHLDTYELYTFFEDGVDMISVPDVNLVSSKFVNNFTKNFNNMYSKIYTLFILNSHLSYGQFYKSIIPFITYQYNLNDKKIFELEQQMKKFKDVLEIARVDKIIYSNMFDVIKPRFNDDDEPMYSNLEKRQLESMKIYKNKYITKCSIIEKLCYKYKLIDFEIKKENFVRKNDDIIFHLNILKQRLNEIYLIKEKRKVLLNKRKLFYIDKEYNNLDILEYNTDNKKVKQELRGKLIKIERDYINRGINLLTEKKNQNKVNDSLTQLQLMGKIKQKDIIIISGLSKPSVMKHLNINWRYDNKKLF